MDAKTEKAITDGLDDKVGDVVAVISGAGGCEGLLWKVQKSPARYAIAVYRHGFDLAILVKFYTTDVATLTGVTVLIRKGVVSETE